MRVGGECIFCGKKLTQENQSMEHIIPNVFGGRLKSKEIFCKSCNNTMGNSIDVDLVKNFELFTWLANPKTERPTYGKIEGNIDGVKVFLHKGGKTTTPYKPTITEEEGEKLQFCFRGYVTEKEDQEKIYRQALATINGKIKDRKITLDELKDMSKTEAIKHPLTFVKPDVSMNGFVLGYLKILLGFCVYKNKISEVKIIDLFRKKESEKIEQYTSFCEFDFLQNGRLCHQIYLIGDNSIQKMYGIVSLYGVIPMVFVLNTDYRGESFIEQYTYDVLNRKEIFEKNSCIDFDLGKIFINPMKEVLFAQMVRIVHVGMCLVLNFFTKKDIDAEEIVDLFFSFINSNNNQYRLFDKEIEKDLFEFFINKRKVDKRLLLITDDIFLEVSKLLVETLRTNHKWKKY
mgnify:CR=1 FL=1